jgi:hypothetical protein
MIINVIFEGANDVYCQVRNSRDSFSRLISRMVPNIIPHSRPANNSVRKIRVIRAQANLINALKESE